MRLLCIDFEWHTVYVTQNQHIKLRREETFAVVLSDLPVIYIAVEVPTRLYSF